MTWRKTGQFGHGLPIERRFDRRLHLLEHHQQARMIDPVTLRQRRPLGRTGAFHLGMKIPVADPTGEIRAHTFRDQRVHHVERGHAAAAGDAVAIENIARLTGSKTGKGLHQGRRMLPVDGEVAILQQSRRCHQIRTAGNAADAHAVAGKLAQAGQHSRNIPVDRRAAGADEDGMETGATARQRRGGDGNAGRRHPGISFNDMR